MVFGLVAGVKIRKYFLTGHKFNNLLKPVSHAEGKMLTFWPSILLENGFTTLKRDAKLKLKLTFLKKVLKVVYFIDFFHVCSVYSRFEFKLKNIIIQYIRYPKFKQ